MTQLSEELRDATADAHASAEGSDFITRLMGGTLDVRAFVLFTAQLHVIYEAFEATLHAHYLEHPLVKGIDDRRLDRREALLADLNHLYPGFEEAIADGSLPIVPAARRYAELLNHEHTAERVVANHYVRYLGDLSGGQAIASLVARHYDVSPDGLGFYSFPEIGKLKAYKDHYRQALDGLVLDDATRSALLAAAVEAFTLNRAVFADLEAELASRDAEVAA
ncbi:biliverdin-producing heme oxygenase [Tessaracoccus terricola]